MSSFNLIEKVKYNKPQNGVVFVKEYIIFEDDHKDDKFVIFKLYNQLNQSLNHIIYEVLQYDSEERLIEKKIIEYNNFKASAQECFVPKAKLRVLANCKSIVCNLIKADFETVIWDNGNFIKIEKSFDDYREIKKEVSGPKVKRPKKVNNKVKESKKFYVKNIIGRNVPKFTNTFIVIMALLSIAYFAVSMFLVNQDKKIYYNGVDYEFTEDGALEAVSCDYGITYINIPESIKDYEVIGIKDNAFSRSTVEVVNIEALDIYIGDNAFSDCKNLNSVTVNNVSSIGNRAFANCISLHDFYSNSCDEVGSYAFADCMALSFANFSNAYIESNAFIGCTNIMELYYGDCDLVSFGEMFGVENEGISNVLENVYTNQSTIASYFFLNASHPFNVYVCNSNCVVEEPIVDVNIIR